MFGLRWCWWGVGRGLDQGLEGWCVSCESGYFCVYSRSVYLYSVLRRRRNKFIMTHDSYKI